MRQAASKFLFNYWNDLRKGRATPVGEHIDPVALNAHIGSIFMLQRDEHGQFALALAGRHCEALAGMTLRGVAFGRLWDAPQARDIERICTGVAQSLLPVVIGATASPPAYAPACLEIMLLPLRPTGASDGMIFGSMALDPDAGWFGLRQSEPFKLVSHRFLALNPINKEHSTHANLKVHQEPDGFLQYSSRKPRSRAHLAIYEGGQALNQHKTGV
ncbi:MAG: PAS domain-containing protein [Hyphomicrobiales bacterium]|nr:PAS domain-containing protein [Hyphomicrobiales bacterium]